MIISMYQVLPDLVLSYSAGTRTSVIAGSLEEVLRAYTVITGPKGDKGDPGNASIETVTWSPPSAQQIWTISHNLGRRPAVTIADSQDRTVFAEVEFTDLNTVRVVFAAPMSGKAYLV